MVRFSYSLDIALRILMFLAYKRCLSSVTSMVNTLGTPYHSSVRVVKILTAAGILTTQRGREGGVRLALPAHDISLKKVMELIDGPLELAYCTTHKQKCAISSICAFKVRLDSLETRINQLIDEVSLANLIAGGEDAFLSTSSA